MIWLALVLILAMTAALSLCAVAGRSAPGGMTTSVIPAEIVQAMAIDKWIQADLEVSRQLTKQGWGATMTKMLPKDLLGDLENFTVTKEDFMPEKNSVPLGGSLSSQNEFTRYVNQMSQAMRTQQLGRSGERFLSDYFTGMSASRG